MRTNLLFLAASFAVLLFNCGIPTSTSNSVGCGDVEYQGHNYETVILGEECWLVQDLRAKVLSDTTRIAEALTLGQWQRFTEEDRSPVVHVIDEGGENETYVYNMWAIASGDLCPVGWRVATDIDWMRVDRQLGVKVDCLDSIGYRGLDESLLEGFSKRVGQSVAEEFFTSGTFIRNDGSYPPEKATALVYWSSTNENKAFTRSSAFQSASWTTGKPDWYSGQSKMPQCRAYYPNMDSVFRGQSHHLHGLRVKCVKEN